MKKGTWVFMLILLLTVSGISTSHAYSKKKSHRKKDIDTIIIEQVTSINKDLEDTTETSERKQADIKTEQPSSDEKDSVANVEGSPQNEDNTRDLFPEIINHKDDVFIEDVYRDVIEETSSLEKYVDYSSGVNYLGYHYELDYFSGFGYLPAWTNNVYQWNNFPSHYLIEKQSYPGQTIFGLHVGTPVIIEGVTYEIYDIIYNQPNNKDALDMVVNSEAEATIQVCVSTEDDSALNLYFLR